MNRVEGGSGAAGLPQIFLDIHSAMGRGDMLEAAALASRALEAGHSDAVLFNLRAWKNETEGRFEAACADLERARALAPGDAKILNALARNLAAAGRFDVAVAAGREAIRIEPRFAAAHYNKGFAHELLGELDLARRCYEIAADLDPAMVDAVARLASLAARRGAWAESRTYAQRALQLQPGHPVAQFSLLMGDLAASRFQKAEQRARAVIADRAVLPIVRANAFSFLGDALDARGLFDEAFAAYLRAKDGFRAVHNDKFDHRTGESTLAMVRRLTHEVEMTATQLSQQNRNATSGEPACAGHVFLLGFPRSGTTLLGQILAALPRVIVVEEKPLLRESIEQFVLQQGGLEQLFASTDLARFRQDYWRKVSNAGFEVGARVVVDQSPLNSIYLPVIAKLFPDAKIIFALRDPRDVVLSCFRRLFAITQYTYEYLSLEGTAVFYDATMNLLSRYRERLSLTICEARNEEFISDFDGASRRLCEFLELEWNPSLRDFATQSRKRAIATPSSTQVIRGISGDGVGRWRDYRKYMSPVLPTLSFWVQQFGYEPE